MSIENQTKINEIALFRKNVEFSIFRFQENLEGTYLHVSGAEITKAQQLFIENKERTNRVIIRCDRLISQLNHDKKTEITTYAFDQFYPLCK